MKLLLTALLLSLLGGMVSVGELSVRLNYLAVKGKTSFPSQLWLQITNEGFTSAPLLEDIRDSELLIDGQAFRRSGAAFRGPEGLPLKGTWEGCIPLDEYVAGGLKPGSHRLQLKLGKTLSPEIRIKTDARVPAATSPADRL